MNYLIMTPTEKELFHHGVLGMHWGIRRYQNKNGSLTQEGKAHLKKYKAKEISKINKKYNKKINKASNEAREQYSKADELIKKNKDSKANKYLTKAAKQEIKANITLGMKKVETSKVNNMKLSDISEERKDVGKTIAKNYLGTVGLVTAASVVGAATLGVVAGPRTVAAATTYAAYTSRPSYVKTQNRISITDADKIERNAYDTTAKHLKKYQR